MGFTVTPLTAVPVNADTSHDQPTFGEAGGPFTVPTMEGPGLGNEVLTSNDANYLWQHAARWVRAIMDRMALANEGFLTKCVLFQGTWNIAGGTLDVTLTPSRIVVDINDDGGTIIEVTAPVGSPETLTALRDVYVEFDESGSVGIIEVANGAGVPAPTAGHNLYFKLVTDATELVSADLVQGIATFPCFGPNTGITNLFAGEVNTGPLTASGVSDLQDDVDVGGELSVVSVSTFTGQTTHEGGITIPTGQDVALSGTTGVTGTKDSIVTCGKIEFVSGGAAATDNGITVNASGELFQGLSRRVCVNPHGYVYATGDREAVSALVITHAGYATTSDQVLAISAGVVRVRVRGMVQVSVLASTVTLELRQEAQPAAAGFVTIGASHVFTATHTQADANAWQSFEFERTYAAGTTFYFLYELKSTSQGGATHKTKEVNLSVTTRGS